MSKKFDFNLVYDEERATRELDSEEFRKNAEERIEVMIQVLGLEGTKNILDVPCGTGRFARRLAVLGHKVTGVDFSTACIRIAKKKKPLKNLGYIQGNMKHLGWAKGKFDLVLNCWNSFGYFPTDADNRDVLKGFVRALKPGGRVVILQNSDYFWEREAEKCFVTEDRFSIEFTINELNEETMYFRTHTLKMEKKTNRAKYNDFYHRVYSYRELRTMMRQCGIKKVKLFDAFTGKPSDWKGSGPYYGILLGTR